MSCIKGGGGKELWILKKTTKSDKTAAARRMGGITKPGTNKAEREGGKKGISAFDDLAGRSADTSSDPDDSPEVMKESEGDGAYKRQTLSKVLSKELGARESQRQLTRPQ